MKKCVCIRTRSEVTRAYFEAILPSEYLLISAQENATAPPCELLLTDLDTVSPPRHVPRGCRHLTLGSDGTPDLLRPMTDSEILDRLFPADMGEQRPRLLEAPPRLAVGAEELPLTEREHRILSLLLAGEEVRCETILAEAWQGRGADANLLRVTLSNLRKKIAPFRFRIESRRGSYAFLASRGG